VNDAIAAGYVQDPVHDPFDKPTLMWHLLHFAPGPNRYGPTAFYELHVWAWKLPHGTCADWSPHVSCTTWSGGPLFWSIGRMRASALHAPGLADERAEAIL